MNARTYWLLGGLTLAVGAWLYSRTQSGTDAVETIVDRVTSTLRGIRDNNPTNLRDAGIQWQGLVGVDPQGFCIFDTMSNGIRAAAINLRNYGRRDGVTTVDGVARRWSQTDQNAYSANLSAWVGVDPQESIDLEDLETRTQLIRGIVRQEEGAIAATAIDGLISRVVADV